jgi:hypothetical protein
MADNSSPQTGAADSTAPHGLQAVSPQVVTEPGPPRDHMRTIIDTIPTLAWSTRGDGTLEFFNRRWLDYTGLAAHDAIAGNWIDTVHPDDRDTLLAGWNAALKSGEPLEVELRQRRFDGQYRWFLVRGAAQRDENGSVTQWYGTNTDIEDRRRAEEALRANEQHLRLIIDSLPGLLFTETPNGTIELVNRRLLEYFGKTLDEVQDWVSGGCVHPDDLERAFREWRDGVASGEPYRIDLRLRRFDGRHRWFQCNVLPLRDAEGRIIRWYGLGTDVDALMQAADASRASEQSFRQIVDNIPGLVYTMTPECALEMVNGQVLEYFGRSFEELEDWDRIGCVHPADLPRVRESLRRTVEHGEPHEVEQRLRRADGVYRWFKPRAMPLRDADGRILRWYCLLSDIDDLKRAEESLRGTQARLARATHLATVSELSASIAHEINQPLAAVIANGQACRQWLSGEPPNVNRARHSAELVVRDGNAAAEVVRRIRSLFKHAPLVKGVLDVNEVIDEVCLLIADDLRARGVALEKDLDRAPLRALADRVQIQQVLVNIVRNGIEAMDAVTDRPRRLAISSRRDGAELVVLVTDHGVGIREPDTVFDSFYSTKPDGLGMGLSICRSIVDAHDGRVWAHRNVPYGSTFGFALRADTGDAR